MLPHDNIVRELWLEFNNKQNKKAFALDKMRFKGYNGMDSEAEPLQISL